MKKKTIITLIILFVGSVKLQAQFFKNKALYVSGELEGGNYLGGNLNVNYILHNNYSFKLGMALYLKDPQNIPKDFSPVFMFGPIEIITNYQMLAGKIFKFKKSGKTRLNLLAGFGYTTLVEYMNWERSSGPLKDGSFHYDYNYNKHGTISFIINPKIEFPIAKIFGFTISPNLSINKNRTTLGLGVGMMFGKTRNDY